MGRIIVELNYTEKYLKVMDTFIILLVIMVLWVYAYAHSYQLYTLNIYSLLHVYYTSIKLL